MEAAGTSGDLATTSGGLEAGIGGGIHDKPIAGRGRWGVPRAP
jgi:hypothetical protein